MSDGLKGKLGKTDIIAIIEDFLTRNLGRNRPELIDYALNKNATVCAKLDNQKNLLGYDFSFIQTSVRNLGNAQAITELDSTSQLVLATTYKPKSKSRRNTKHENTKTIKDSSELHLDSNEVENQ